MCAWRRLLRDECGLAATELVVVLVLVLAVSISLWNLFGNDVGCRLAEAIDSYDQAHAVASQCRDGSGAPVASGRGSATTGKGAASARASTGASSAAVRANPVPPQAPPPPSSPPPPPPDVLPEDEDAVVDSPPQESSLAARAGRALQETGRQLVDFTEGVIVGAVPGGSSVPGAKPSFGNEVTFGVGQLVGSSAGLLGDSATMVSGLGGGGLAIAAIPETGGASAALLPAAGELVAVGAVAAVGHGSNFMKGLDNIAHGENSPSVESSGGGAGNKGWKVGDDVNKPTAAGKEPKWSTVRSRFWKNEAAAEGAAEKYGAENAERMKKGLAPRRYNQAKGDWESMELSHEPIPQRDGGKDFVPRWPQEHAEVDPFRRPGY